MAGPVIRAGVSQGCDPPLGFGLRASRRCAANPPLNKDGILLFQALQLFLTRRCVVHVLLLGPTASVLGRFGIYLLRVCSLLLKSIELGLNRHLRFQVLNSICHLVGKTLWHLCDRGKELRCFIELADLQKAVELLLDGRKSGLLRQAASPASDCFRQTPRQTPPQRPSSDSSSESLLRDLLKLLLRVVIVDRPQKASSIRIAPQESGLYLKSSKTAGRGSSSRRIGRLSSHLLLGHLEGLLSLLVSSRLVSNRFVSSRLVSSRLVSSRLVSSRLSAPPCRQPPCQQLSAEPEFSRGKPLVRRCCHFLGLHRIGSCFLRDLLGEEECLGLRIHPRLNHVPGPPRSSQGSPFPSSPQ